MIEMCVELFSEVDSARVSLEHLLAIMTRNWLPFVVLDNRRIIFVAMNPKAQLAGKCFRYPVLVLFLLLHVH